MTQKELTAIGILAESKTAEMKALAAAYPLGYDSMPVEKRAELDGLTLEAQTWNEKYAAGYTELNKEARTELTTGSRAALQNPNRLGTPGEQLERGKRIDEYGFSQYEKERKGKLLNFRDNEEGRRLAELVGAISLACCPTLEPGSDMKQLGLRVLRERHNIDNPSNMRATELGGMQQRDLTSAVESYGGVLVPTVLEAAILILQEDYGVLEQYANVIPMGAGEVKWPKRFQGPAAVHTLETLPSSFDKQMKFNSYSLNAVDSYCFVSYPNQLSQDSIIPLGDYVAGQIAWAQSYRWNDDLVNGDGSAQYGNTKGLVNQFNATLPNGNPNPGLFSATTSGSATDWSKLTLTDFAGTKGLMRMYQRNSSKWKWFTTWAFYCEVMQPLQANANYGWETTFGDGKVSMTMNSQMFQGHEVVIVPGPLMPTSAGGEEIVCFFGSMDMAVTMGIRLGLDILSSQVAGLSFLTNSTYVRGIQRACVNPHSVGLDTLDPLGTNIAGPLVAMKTNS